MLLLKGYKVVKCCRLLLHQIVLSYGAIHPCCSFTIASTNSQLAIGYNGQIIDIDEYVKNRQVHVDAFNSGDLPACYKNCSLYEDCDNLSSKVCFEVINVSNRTNCNCNCIYCDLRENGNQEKRDELNKRVPYDIHPVLTDMQNKNLISYRCEYFIGGGEVSEYPKEEIEWLLLFALSNNCNIQLMSSAIKFSPEIAKVLSVATVNFKISPDAGTKKTYEKVKRVKAFDRVWKNIAAYIQAAKNNPEAVIEIKYVLIPGVNDSVEELDAFLKMCKKAKVENIVVDIEHYWLYSGDEKKIPDSLVNAVKYFENVRFNSKEFNLNYIQVGKDFLLGLVR